jgi:hypothetical protein
MGMYRIWTILSRFKEFCRNHGWKTCESDDWVEIDERYHNFLSAGNIHPSSFKRIVTSRKCIVREGLTYNVVEASYTAWLFSKRPSKDLVGAVLENPDFAAKTAVYDLSPLLKGKKTCLKLNDTDSPVFQEFENFLQTELKVNFKPISPLPNRETNADNCTISELA